MGNKNKGPWGWDTFNVVEDRLIAPITQLIPYAPLVVYFLLLASILLLQIFLQEAQVRCCCMNMNVDLI